LEGEPAAVAIGHALHAEGVPADIERAAPAVSDARQAEIGDRVGVVVRLVDQVGVDLPLHPGELIARVVPVHQREALIADLALGVVAGFVGERRRDQGAVLAGERERRVLAAPEGTLLPVPVLLEGDLAAVRPVPDGITLPVARADYLNKLAK